MALNKNALCSIVCNVIKTIDPTETVRVAEMGGTVPSESFASVKLLSTTKRSGREVTYSDEGTYVNEHIAYLKELFFSVQFFRGDAVERCTKFDNLISSTAVDAVLYPQGVGLGVRSSVRNLTEVIDQNFEQRAQIDLQLYVVDSDALAVTYIEQVNIDYDLQVDGNVIGDQITIDKE